MHARGIVVSAAVGGGTHSKFKFKLQPLWHMYVDAAEFMKGKRGIVPGLWLRNVNNFNCWLAAGASGTGSVVTPFPTPDTTKKLFNTDRVR